MMHLKPFTVYKISFFYVLLTTKELTNIEKFAIKDNKCTYSC